MASDKTKYHQHTFHMYKGGYANIIVSIKKILLISITPQNNTEFNVRCSMQTTTYRRKDLDPQLSGDILPSGGQT